jgi:hypothetical protein
LRQLGAEREDSEVWRITWAVENKAGDVLEIASVRSPHGQFKSAELRFEPALRLAPQAAAQFQLDIRCKEAAGLVTENAFVIFTVNRSAESWRVFVRLRVVVDAEGRPQTATELVTAQRVGFSGIAS